MAHPKGVYDFYENGNFLVRGTFESAAKKLNYSEATVKKKCQLGEYTKKYVCKEKTGNFEPRKTHTKPVKTKYKLISADYENIQVVELENGERAVMSKKTGKLVKNECATTRRGRLLKCVKL